MEDYGRGKRVTFKEEEKMKGKVEDEKIRREIEEQVNKETKKLNDKINEIRKMLIEYMEEMKTKTKKWEMMVKDMAEKVEKHEERLNRNGYCKGGGGDGEGSYKDSTGIQQGDSKWGESRIGSEYVGSTCSWDRFSEREVNIIKIWMEEKDKEDRHKNIVVKGLTWKEEGDRRKQVEEYIKKKLGVDCKLKKCKLSGKVIVANLASEEEKKEIKRNKYKLKGEKVFIENDLSWEERRVQEEMNKWVRKMRERGEEGKVGRGRVKIGGVWKRWGG